MPPDFFYSESTQREIGQSKGHSKGTWALNALEALYLEESLRSQFKFPASYPKYCFASFYKVNPDVKLCRMLLKYPEIQLLDQHKHKKICRSCE